MTVSPISSMSSTAVSQVQHGHHHGMRKAGMEAAAKALGMSDSDLRTAVQNGQSLSSLAQSKGVSVSELTSAISSALTSANPSLSSDRAQQIAQRMIQGPESSSQSAQQSQTSR